MKRRILSIILALTMVLALLPSAALAAERPAYAPYRSVLKSYIGQAGDHDSGNGLFADLDGDGLPELLAAYRFNDNSGGVSIFTIENGRAKWLLNADSCRGDISFYSSDYTSLDVVSRGGSVYVMASKSQYYETTPDDYYGKTFWNRAEFWLYQLSDGALAQADHWSYQFHELEDGRYFEGEGGVKHNGAAASVEALDDFWDSISILLTVSHYDDTDGMPLKMLLRMSEGKFVDVEPEEYYALPVDWAVANGITNGTSTFTFSPMDPCTRGQVVTFLWRAAGSPEPKQMTCPFTDVQESDYFYQAVLWAGEQGITNGIDAAHFGPDQPCTRAHVVTFLWRANGRPAAGTANPFLDVDSGAYYYDAVLWAVENGITNGINKRNFGPENTCIRGQIVTFLFRAMADPDQPIPPTGSQLKMAISAGDNFYEGEQFGQNLARYVTENTDTAVTVASVGESEENLRSLLNGEVQMCFCRADVAYDAYHGLGRYAEAGENHDFSVVTVLISPAVVPFSTDWADESVADLRGKTVSVGPEGSNLLRNTVDILSVYGMTLEDIHPVYLSLEDTADAVYNDEVDAAFIPSGSEWSNLMERYGFVHKFNDLPLDAEHMQALFAAAPYFTLTGEYNTNKPEVPVLLLTRNDVPDDDVFNVISTITDQWLLPSAYWQLSSDNFPANARGVPYHPVAAKWFGI